MNILELDTFNLHDAIKYHDQLNPVIFKNDKMYETVREQLLLIAQDFMEHLGVNNLDIKDITLSGSNAAYTYTPHSDVDVHIIVDIAKLRDDDVYRELFNSKKIVFNDTHDIKIHGYDVELYVQDSAEPVKSLGEYSILNNKWIKFPSKKRANFDERGAREKFKKLVQLSELALRTKNLKKLDNLLQTIHKYRKAGLSRFGEFGAENLAYKALRSKGILDKLYDHRDSLHSQDLSLNTHHTESVLDEFTNHLMREYSTYTKTEEDWHPNDTPPGPEIKPTMPKGTVKVDVSDVYDWYKLGQHISNLHGLGHHDFGKGPPSTIMSFGDEDTEHKYIQDLEKTGLTTTDIDPASHKKMPGQKVDPTYNVDENLSSFIIDLPDIQRGDRILHPQWGPCVVFGFKNGGNTTILRAKNDPKNRDISIETWRLKDMMQEIAESASGYIPSEKEKNDPRFKTGLTVDVKPDSIKKNAKKLGLGNIHRSGIPPIANANGKI